MFPYCWKHSSWKAVYLSELTAIAHIFPTRGSDLGPGMALKGLTADCIVPLGPHKFCCNRSPTPSIAWEEGVGLVAAKNLVGGAQARLRSFIGSWRAVEMASAETLDRDRLRQTHQLADTTFRVRS